MKNQKPIIFLVGIIVTLLIIFVGANSLNSLQTSVTNSDLNKFTDSLQENTDLLSDEDIPIIIKFKEKPSVEQENKIKKDHKGKIKYTYENFNYLATSLPQTELEALSLDSDVELIEYDMEVTANLDIAREEIQGDSAFQKFGFTGEGIKVAVIDSGISHIHPAIADRIVAEIDFTGEGPDDLNGHGTHVACIIGCRDEIYKGVAPNVDIYNAKILNRNASGTISDVLAAIDWGIEQDVDIMNMSFGGQLPNCGADIMSEATNHAADLGIVMIAAAGNQWYPGYIDSPGCAEKAITVGCYFNGTVCEFSSKGPLFDGTIKPDIIAPGVNIDSARRVSGFYPKTGTSQSTPLIAGLAALLLEANNNLSQDEVKNIIKETALDLGYPETEQGAGLAQAYAAIESVYLPDTKFCNKYKRCLDEAEQLKKCEKLLDKCIKKEPKKPKKK